MLFVITKEEGKRLTRSALTTVCNLDQIDDQLSKLKAVLQSVCKRIHVMIFQLLLGNICSSLVITDVYVLYFMFVTTIFTHGSKIKKKEGDRCECY